MPTREPIIGAGEPAPPSSRKPGRAFGAHHDMPLGHDLLSDEPGARRRPLSAVAVADRARAVAVLRKADELMRNHDPAGNTVEGARRALELACGRAGVTPAAYVAIVRGDPEVAELERQVLADARRRG